MDQAPECDEVLNVTGYLCPLPLLKMKQKLTLINAGAVLHVITSDKGSVRDFNVFLKQAGHELLLYDDLANEYHFWIKKR